MEKTTSSNGFATAKKLDTNVNKIEHKLEDVSKKVMEKADRLGTDLPGGLAMAFRESRKFVQKNPYTGIAVSTSVGLILGLAFSNLVKNLWK